MIFETKIYANSAFNVNFLFLQVVRDHPEWWFLLSMDGFASHLNVREALEIFDQFKILLLKEEGDSSHVNQSYDQLVAKQDKLLTKTYLGMFRTYLKGNIDQYLLVATLYHVF